MEVNGIKRREKEEAIIGYLLGALPEVESDHFEQRYLEDERLFEELREIEDELIDDYASGALTGEYRVRFEQYFLRSPERREKLRFALDMTERAVAWKKESKIEDSLSQPVAEFSPVDATESNQSRSNVLVFKRWSRSVPAWRQWAAIAAAVLIAVGSGVLWLRYRDLRRDLQVANAREMQSREQASVESSRAQQAEADLARERKRAFDAQTQTPTQQEAQLQPQKTIVAAFLSVEYFTPTTMGAGEIKKKTLDVPLNARALRLGVEFEHTRFRTFSATLQHADGSSSWSTPGNLKASSSTSRQTVMLKIPAEGLSTGDYWLSISGVGPEGYRESIGSYYLKVVRR